NSNGRTIISTGNCNLHLWYTNTATYHGSINNLVGGLFNIQNDQSLLCALCVSEYFNNVGTVRKSAGTGTTTISVLLNNTGTVDRSEGRRGGKGGGRGCGALTAAV